LCPASGSRADESSSKIKACADFHAKSARS
jgi:hypothetical protein